MNASSSPDSTAADSIDGIASDDNTDPDALTGSERRRFCDRTATVLVAKRDAASASPVKVASMDYVVPEKAPQPSCLLESMVWDRERDVDRMRERFQLARALSLAKVRAHVFI